MGYGIISCERNKPVLLETNVLKLGKLKDIYERLQRIHERIHSLITAYRPSEFAIEAPFFGKNVQSMLKLGRAQGVAIAAAMQAGLAVKEYSPKKVKQSVTGNGNASKEMVWKMLQHHLDIQEKPAYYDATDALAVALCHYFQSKGKNSPGVKPIKSWEEFIKKNPGRLHK
jgi:crossover junction endodeoxyribonuclease RuvC